MNIHFIQAGGTIDKVYPRNPDNHGYNFAVGTPAFLDILGRAGYSMNVSHSVACVKDSLDMTYEDRHKVSVLVRDAPSDRIVITHGTDTIIKTATAIAALAGALRTVVITGAMMPGGFRNSDADFNLGMAVAAAQILPKGIYIVLNGKVEPWFDYVST
jgi:L-asparaginase